MTLKPLPPTTKAPLVVGGSGFSVMPAALMDRLRVDYGISGEAERAFPALLDALEAGSSPNDVPNLHYFSGGELRATQPATSFLDMSTLAWPDRSLVDPCHYARHGMEALQTKRGCPLRCDYCTYPIIEGRIGRTRPAVDVVDEWMEIAEGRPEVQHVFIVDSVFNLPRTHAKAVCREMIGRGATTPWTCYVNPLGFDEELAELMANANCAGMEVGSDSGSDAILRRLRKGFTTQHIRKLHDIAEGAEIPDCHTFLLGTPGESFDDVLRTLEFIAELDPYSAILMAWVDDYEALDPDLARERQMLRDQILELLDAHKGEFPWWSIPSLGVNYDPGIFEMLRRRGYRGPLWQHLRRLAPEQRPRRRGRSPHAVSPAKEGSKAPGPIR
jgi:radical SAM superfamily enzyme YgiQ (UPF0313 family)